MMMQYNKEDVKECVKKLQAKFAIYKIIIARIIATHTRAMAKIVVSIALPVYNAQDFLEDCFNSILSQNRTLSLPSSKKEDSEVDSTLTAIDNFEIEVSLYEDGSTDQSPIIIEEWTEILSKTSGFLVRFSKNESGSPKGGK